MSTLITDIAIRAPELQDMEEFLLVMQKSKSLHKNWVPNAPYEQDAYLDFLKRFESYHTFGYLCTYNNQIFAAIIISQIVRDFLQSGYLGYYGSYISQQNKGIMSQAFKLVLKEAFDTLELHRLEANIQPTNTASMWPKTGHHGLTRG